MKAYSKALHWHNGNAHDISASTQKKIFSGFPTMQDSNQSPQLQRLTRKNESSSETSLDNVLSKKTNIKGAD